jgi:ubiquinone/menaquinone biosynthesis C-methylase UbiE
MQEMSQMAAVVLDNNNGERMVPEATGAETFWEHVYRYAFALQYISGKSVLDIACGEGYGSAALLRAGASRVIGVDVSEMACAHARRKYGIDARQGSAEAIPLSDSSVDAIVSFETIEHVPNPYRFLDECARVLVPGGTIVISTPNKGIYRSDVPANPHHCSEMTEEEFSTAVRERFQGMKLYTQRPRSAGWWSVRTFASDLAPWTGFRPLHLIHRYLRLRLVSETLGEPTPKQRESVTDVILRISRSRHGVLNPYSVRPQHNWTRETPTYLIATAFR